MTQPSEIADEFKVARLIKDQASDLAEGDHPATNLGRVASPRRAWLRLARSSSGTFPARRGTPVFAPLMMFVPMRERGKASARDFAAANRGKVDLAGAGRSRLGRGCRQVTIGRGGAA